MKVKLFWETAIDFWIWELIELLLVKNGYKLQPNFVLIVHVFDVKLTLFSTVHVLYWILLIKKKSYVLKNF